MLRVVRPRDPQRPADVVVALSGSARAPFDPAVPTNEELSRGAELTLEQFDEPTENTPITAVSPWQRLTPPPLPQSEDG